MKASKLVLKSTGEQVFPLGSTASKAMQPPHGYSDVIIPRSGMKRKMAVTTRVHDSKIQKQ